MDSERGGCSHLSRNRGYAASIFCRVRTFALWTHEYLQVREIQHRLANQCRCPGRFHNFHFFIAPGAVPRGDVVASEACRSPSSTASMATSLPVSAALASAL